MFYLIGAINSFKLQDGIDGLAAGLAVIAACFFGVIFYLQDDLFGLLIAALSLVLPWFFSIIILVRHRFFLALMGVAF